MLPLNPAIHPHITQYGRGNSPEAKLLEEGRGVHDLSVTTVQHTVC